MTAVAPKDLQADVEVVSISCKSTTSVLHMLTVHSVSGASIWDLSGQQLLAVVNHLNRQAPKTLRAAGQVASASWLTGDRWAAAACAAHAQCAKVL